MQQIMVQTCGAFELPIGWLEKAISLPGGKVGQVALFIVAEAQANEENSTVVRQKKLDTLGVNRVTVYRCLNALQAAGLIKLHRFRGSAPVVNIVDPDGVDEVEAPGDKLHQLELKILALQQRNEVQCVK